jgi:hypothetical protein
LLVLTDIVAHFLGLINVLYIPCSCPKPCTPAEITGISKSSHIVAKRVESRSSCNSFSTLDWMLKDSLFTKELTKILPTLGPQVSYKPLWLPEKPGCNHLLALLI